MAAVSCLRVSTTPLRRRPVLTSLRRGHGLARGHGPSPGLGRGASPVL
jgi:hypothetical protein